MRRTLPVYLAISFGASWLLVLPTWFTGGLESPAFLPLTVAMMFTPAIAALVVVLAIEKPARPAVELGLWPLRPVRRLLGYAGLALVIPVLLVLVALPIGAALGVYPQDFAGLSGFAALLRDAGVAELPIPLGALVALQLVNVLVGAFINLVPALGEELGWRGWLLPRLLPLGTVPAIVLSGVIWGLWHAPVILIGYNYPTAPGWLGVLCMIGMCILLGGVFGWLRLRSGSVWPAALAHGALNASAGFTFVFAQEGATVDTTQAGILGWSGWIVPFVLVAVLVLVGAFRPRATTPAG